MFEDDPNVNPETLCEMHLAEYEGLTVAELRRQRAEELAEMLDGW
jgi:hypothetical protein